MSKINEVVVTYDTVVKVVDSDANKSASSEEGRAYGGVLRSVKGKLQEHITDEAIRIAWANIGGVESRLMIDSKKHRVPIKRNYVEALEDLKIKKHILDNIADYAYGISVDKQVYIDDVFVLGIECKAYTENAMIKRILVDFSLLKTIYPDLNCYLFQLESQLGGDYSDLKEITFGSKPTHTLMSYFPEVKLNVFTFLEGERKVDEPIHKKEFFKPLKREQVEKAVTLLAADLKNHL